MLECEKSGLPVVQLVSSNLPLRLRGLTLKRCTAASSLSSRFVKNSADVPRPRHPPYVRGFTSLAVRKIVISNKLHDLRLDLGREEEAGRRRGRGIQLENDEDALNTFWLDTPSRYAPLEASLSLYEREESGRRVGGGRPGGVLSTRRLSSSRQLAPTLLLLQTAYSTMLSLQNKRKRLLISPSACIAPKIARRTSALLLQGRDTTGERECGRLVTVDTDGVQGAFLVLLSFLEERSEMGAHSSGEDNSAGD